MYTFIRQASVKFPIPTLDDPSSHRINTKYYSWVVSTHVLLEMSLPAD